MKKLIIGILNVLLILAYTAPTNAGPPRELLQTSMYSPEVASRDRQGRDDDSNTIQTKTISIHQIEKRVPCSGKINCMDCQGKAAPPLSRIKEDIVTFKGNKAYIFTENRTYQIPIIISGKEVKNAEQMGRRKKREMGNALATAFNTYGLTPAGISMKYSDGQWDGVILRASLYGHEIKLHSFNIKITENGKDERIKLAKFQ